MSRRGGLYLEIGIDQAEQTARLLLAAGFAEAAGLPYADGFVRNRYIGRTFIAPTQELRSLGVRMKLNPLRDNIEALTVAIIMALAAIREKLRYSNVPEPLRGLGITFILVGLMSLGFMSFSGIQL